MNDAINDALNYEESWDHEGTDPMEDEICGYLPSYKLEDKLKDLQLMTLDDFKNFRFGKTYKVVEYIGWTHSFNDYKKIYVCVDREYVVFGIMTSKFLKDNITQLKLNNFKINYNGIKLNSKGQEYAQVHFYILPDW